MGIAHHPYILLMSTQKFYNTPTSGSLSISLPTSLSVTQTNDGSLIVHQAASAFTLYHAGTSAEIGREGSADADLPSSVNSFTVSPGSSVIVELGTSVYSRGAYWPEVSINDEDGRSYTQESMALVQVPWAAQASAVFRPPVLGTDALTQFLRSVPIFEHQVDLTVLPSSITLAASAPSLSYLEGKFDFYSGDHYSGWNTDTRTPGYQHPGYGSFMAGIVSEAMTVLCSDIPMEDKRPLATKMCQWGLDLAGAFASGRENYMADGGHMLGRTPLLILTGKLLNISLLANPQTLFASSLVESEGNQYYTETDAWWCSGTPNYGWSKHWTSDHFIASAPSTWTSGNIFDFSYFDQTVGCQVGSMLALKLMGIGDTMGVACREVIEWFMDGGPDAVYKAELVAVGLTVDWGKSYAIGSPNNFCADAWKQVY